MVLNSQPIYASSIASRAPGIDEQKFPWQSREWFVPDLVVGFGRGGRRLWSGFGILRMGVASYLSDHGVKFPDAYNLAGTLLTYGETADDFNYLVALVQGEDGFHDAAGRRGFRTLAELLGAVPQDDIEALLIVNVGKIAGSIQQYL